MSSSTVRNLEDVLERGEHENVNKVESIARVAHESTGSFHGTLTSDFERNTTLSTRRNAGIPNRSLVPLGWLNRVPSYHMRKPVEMRTVA